MADIPENRISTGLGFPLSRRNLFKGAGVAALAGVASCQGAGKKPGAAQRIPLVDFASIGVRPMINCKGTYTIISGSLMLPEVKAAMMAAAEGYVHMDELMEGVGRRIAELTGAEWGMITAGCNAAQFGAACAAMVGTDPEKMALLPDTTGMKNEMLTPASHRNVYDRAFTMTGATLIGCESVEDMEKKVSDRTAMICVLGDQSDRGDILLEDLVRIGKENGIPVMVDAAAERPDAPNLYIEAGCDLVAYSGGKCLRGPQSSGLLIGRKDLCKAAFLNLSPHHALGRPMKCGKEEIMGCLAALDLWINGRDHDAEWQEWLRRFQYITDEVTTIASVKTEVVNPRMRSNDAPRLSITWDRDVVKIDPGEVSRLLDEGDPRIAMNAGRDGMSIMSYMMEDGDEIPVARRLLEILSSAV